MAKPALQVVLPTSYSKKTRRSQARQYRLSVERSRFDRKLKTAYVYPESVVKAAADRLARGGDVVEITNMDGRVLAEGTRDGESFTVNVVRSLSHDIHNHAPLPWERPKRQATKNKKGA